MVDDYRIRTNYDDVFSAGFRVDGYTRFFECEALDVVADWFAWAASLIDVRGAHFEFDSGVAQDFGAAGGGGGEDEFLHGCFKKLTQRTRRARGTGERISL